MPKQWYVGLNHSVTPPVREPVLTDGKEASTPQYRALIGPMHCYRCAKWGAANPMWSHADDVQAIVHSPTYGAITADSTGAIASVRA